MIDLEKLRELAQDANTAEQWYAAHDMTSCSYDYDKAFIAASSPAVVLELLDYVAQLEKDAGRLNFMQEEALDARCVEIGEDSYGWQIMSHFMAEPKLRMVGESHDVLGLRQAIDTAMESKHG